MSTTIEKQPILDLLTTFRYECDRASDKEARSGKECTAGRKRATQALKRLCKLIGVDASEAELAKVADWQYYEREKPAPVLSE